MRKVIQAFCLFLCTALVTVQTAQAANPSAADIFKTIGGTTTIDRGGAIHSQARSIYSMGGGMTSFEGKRVSLLAADPPSFSAGCNGISWHFGGFSFISLDEIRQLVEAVAQASLGIAVDLAMQTLCPQCYAVMAKLRDISNLMRNAAADACSIAKNMGEMLKDKGVFTSTGRASKCSELKGQEGKTNGYLESWAGSACRNLTDVENALNTEGKKVMEFLNYGNPSKGKAPDKDTIELSGNVTYKGLTALGYQDGPIKDLMLSILGMTVVYPESGADCTQAFAGLSASSSNTAADNKNLTAEQAIAANNLLANGSKDKVPAAVAGSRPTVADAATNKSQAPSGGATGGVTTCHAPPLISGVTEIGRVLLCGNDPYLEAAHFAGKFMNESFDAVAAVESLKQTSLGAMCLVQRNEESSNPYVYTCRANETGECRAPKMVTMKQLLQARPEGAYTGLAWMVGDALYSGVQAVRDNEPLPVNTKRILNGSGWPLYRLLNMAAVYPAMAGELLNAYSSAIAAQYAMDSLDKLVRIGAQPGISMKSITGLQPEDVSVIREHIMEQVREGNQTKTQVLDRLAEKSQLVDVIMRVNKTLQAEVIGQGLGGNTSLAVSIKRQMNPKPAPTK